MGYNNLIPASEESIQASKVRFQISPSARSIFQSVLLSEILHCKKQNSIVIELELNQGSVRRNF